METKDWYELGRNALIHRATRLGFTVNLLDVPQFPFERGCYEITPPGCNKSFQLNGEEGLAMLCEMQEALNTEAANVGN